MLGDIPAKPTKTAHHFRCIYAKKRLLGCVWIPISLASITFPTNGRTPTRTGDLIDVNDAARYVKVNNSKASSSLENKRWVKCWVYLHFSTFITDELLNILLTHQFPESAECSC
jgi:hypothetical protein